jgi:hypothetical protein
MKKLLLATAITLSAGAAFAQENNVVLSFDTFEKNGVTTEGLQYDFEGSLGDFAYEGYAFDGDVNNVDAKAAGLKANWTGLNLGQIAVGPALSYDRASIAGISGDDAAAGVAMKTSFGSVDVKGDALFSLDTSNAWVGTIDGRMPIGEKLTALAEYSYVDVGDQFESHQLELGARYDVTPNAFVQATIDAERSAGDTGTGASLGLGLKF